ncbi:MAG: amino acid ABC transporter permease [Deltaproteobacteria bacterium]|nr:amino acid ABC transporter permease [Candidatus Zymogenaceae bacterium]
MGVALHGFGLIFIKYMPLFWKATLMTVEISALSIMFGFLIGLFSALGKMSHNKLISIPSKFYVWFFRATPLLVQIFLIYFGLPQFGIRLSPFVAGVIAMSINAGAYYAEIIRAGIQSVHHGQMEAARSLGMSYPLSMRRIILPQAIKVIVPPFGNESIILIKDTSLLSTITILEVTLMAQRLISSTWKPFELYLIAAFYYAVITSVLNFFLHRYEKKLAISQRRG